MGMDPTMDYPLTAQWIMIPPPPACLLGKKAEVQQALGTM